MSFKNAVGHFRTITSHRHMVIRHAFKAGIIWRGLMHDLSKYTPTEFGAGIKYYAGGKFSANNTNYGMTGCAIESKIYTIVAQKNAIYCYDTEKDEVTALGSKLPVNTVVGSEASAFENKAYFFVSGKIYRFDPESNNVETSEISLSYGTNGPAVDTVESVIYVVSGYNNKNVEKYLPQIGLMTLPYGSLKIIPKANDNVFAIINSYASYIEVGVDKVFKGNKENGGEYQEAYLYKNGAWVKI